MPRLPAEMQRNGTNPEDAFIEMQETFRVNLYRKPLSEKCRIKTGNFRKKFGIDSGEGHKTISSEINSTLKKILTLLSDTPERTGEVLAEQRLNKGGGSL